MNLILKYFLLYVTVFVLQFGIVSDCIPNYTLSLEKYSETPNTECETCFNLQSEYIEEEKIQIYFYSDCFLEEEFVLLFSSSDKAFNKFIFSHWQPPRFI